MSEHTPEPEQIGTIGSIAIKTYRFRQFYIPARMMGGIVRYIEEGQLPGQFLQAVICNDLFEAVGRADDENMANLPAYSCYFYNEAPGNCWGSAEIMKQWAEKKRKKRENALSGVKETP